MSRLDEFTLNVLCNAEVIDVNQDPLGKQARIVRQSGDEFVLVKPLEDGSLALGLFNLSDTERTVSVSWAEAGLKGRQSVRDGLAPASGRCGCQRVRREDCASRRQLRAPHARPVSGNERHSEPSATARS